MAFSDPERIIAIDLRPQTLGFVVFEGKENLIDWGVKSFRHGVNTVRVPLGSKVVELIADYVPDAIVLRKRLGTEPMLRELHHGAASNHVSIHSIPIQILKAEFSDCRNKQRTAEAVAERFIDLLPFLPPKRKLWKREDHRMRIFDAAATGIAYLSQTQKKAASPAFTD